MPSLSSRHPHRDRVAVPTHSRRALRAEESSDLGRHGGREVRLRRARSDECRDPEQCRLLIRNPLQLLEPPLIQSDGMSVRRRGMHLHSAWYWLWTVRSLPALAVSASGAPDDWAVNDFVVVRRGSGQVVAEVAVDGELYVRLAGDGLAVATPIGSSAYSMAAGGPVLAANTAAFVCTPVAMHGRSAPPLVVPADARVTVELHVGYAGFDVEIDGHRRSFEATSFGLTRQENMVELVTFAPSGASLGALRRRGLITDSPRVLARDDRGQ